MYLGELFKQILFLSLAGSILSIAILLIKSIFRKKLSAKVHYYIWFLLVLKLVVPLNFQSMLNPFNYISADTVKIEAVPFIPDSHPGSTAVNTNDNKTENIIPSDDNKKTALKFNFTTAGSIWLSGVTAFLLYTIIINISLILKLKKSSSCKEAKINSVLEHGKLKLKINSKIPLLYDKSLNSPSVYGIISPKILISEALADKLSLEELKFILLHELNHIKRKDLLINVLIVLLQIVYWFNPVILYSLHQFKQDSEAACDEATLAILNSDEITTYGHTVINLLQMLPRHKFNAGTLGFSNKFNKRKKKRSFSSKILLNL